MKILKSWLKWNILYVINISALSLIDGELTSLILAVGVLGSLIFTHNKVG